MEVGKIVKAYARTKKELGLKVKEDEAAVYLERVVGWWEELVMRKRREEEEENVRRETTAKGKGKVKEISSDTQTTGFITSSIFLSYISPLSLPCVLSLSLSLYRLTSHLSLFTNRLPPTVASALLVVSLEGVSSSPVQNPPS